MIPNSRSMHKTLKSSSSASQLFHRRPREHQHQYQPSQQQQQLPSSNHHHHHQNCHQTSTTNRVPNSDDLYNSPHPAIHNTLLQRNHSHHPHHRMADNDYSEILTRNEFSNGGAYNNFHEYTFATAAHQHDPTSAVLMDLESASGRDRLLPPPMVLSNSPQYTYAPNQLLDRMAPIFRTMKLFGFYGPVFGSSANDRGGGSSLPPTRHRNSLHGLFLRSRSRVNVQCILMITYTLFSVLFNVGLFAFNILGIELAREHLGLLHVLTMTNIISGMKPLHNFFNLLLILRGWKYHAQLWRQLSEIDEMFRRYLAIKLDVRRYKLMFFALTTVSFLVPFAMRASEYFLLETIGEVLVSDLSLLFVPLLSIWQLMPLYYYLLITSFIQWWFRKLRMRLQNDSELTEHPLEFYYRLYLRLTKSVCTLGSFFNPVAFFSIATSVVVLCLTIYFLTNAKEIVIRDGPDDEQLASYFYVSWSGVHIFVAMAYVLTMCVAGWRTNERAREIMSAVLSTRPMDEQSRFRVSCFIHRNQTQWTWGISVWRAFPVERSFLFTLVSAISTYAVLLLKLQQKACVCGVQRTNETGFD